MNQRAPTTGTRMHDAASMSNPIALIARYLWRHRIAHALVVLAILGAVAASVAARYSMKFIVDAMAEDRAHLAGAWQAVLIFTASVPNRSIVRVFANRARETARLAQALAAETDTHRRALIYIERLRLAHAVAVWVVSGAVLAWSVKLWAAGAITSGDVVVCGSFGLA